MQLTKQGAVLFAQGSHKKVSIAEHATRRSNRRTCAVPYCMRGYAPRLAARANDGNIRQSKTLEDPFRHPFRPLLPNIARVRARPCGRFRERCVFGNERSLVANGREDAPSMTPLGIAPTAPPHALARFLAAAAENPSQTLATKRNHPRTQREGGPEGPPSLEARCPLKRVRAISRGAVPRAGRSA